MKKFLLAAMASMLCMLSPGQKNLPTIKASSVSVDIREGDQLNRNGWTISPQIQPDIHFTSAVGKRITFITDKDSISVVLTKTTKFDFIILLNDTTKALTEIAYKPSYLDVLKSAGSYNKNDHRDIPAFTYQSKDDRNLQSLRKGFNLDSIAGGGTDVSRILRLMHWVHDLIPHDGQHENPTVKNAMSMIAECKKGNRGLNCRGLATVLNECYLSLGIPSRFVTCMPQDSVFDDCHVINLVYSTDLKKWLWVDPTNDAYVMNEKGELLDIREVRERLVDGKPLLLNPEANWNHKQTQSKQYYLEYYMAKNLFRLQCPTDSKYDYETWQQGKTVTYVELLPLNTFGQSPQKETHTNAKTGTTFINYKTNNPDLFWQTPK
jgi:transglutaminase-like putative cysteine protease